MIASRMFIAPGGHFPPQPSAIRVSASTEFRACMRFPFAQGANGANFANLRKMNTYKKPIHNSPEINSCDLFNLKLDYILHANMCYGVARRDRASLLCCQV